jgi:hypothetical protein
MKNYRISFRMGLFVLTTLLFISSLQSQPRQKRQMLPFFDAVMRVIESGPEFINIKGRAMGDGDYESLIQIPGGIRPRVFQPALGGKGWLVDLATTTNKEEATQKYNDIAEQFNTTGKWSIGTVIKNEDETSTGHTTSWEPSVLDKAYEKTHRNFIMELVMSKNFRKQYEVYLKIRYDN